MSLVHGGMLLSNVLIGIIGVILFIGLALAGALFLGPRFQESTISSKASRTVQATAQVANAMSLYLVNSGYVPTTGQQMTVADLVASGYLKSNPMSVSAYAFNPTMGISNLYLPETDEGRSICWNIQRQTGQIGPGDEPDMATGRYVTSVFPKTPSGCLRHGPDADSRMLVYSRF